MKPRLPIILSPRGNWLPPRGSRARLPFLLIPVLAGMAAVQLALPEHIDLPPGGSVARFGLVPLPDAPPAVIAPKLLASRNLFAPPVKQGGEGTTDPLNGAVIAGVLQKGRFRLGIVQQANGQVRYIATGGTVAGWRLVSLDQAGARLSQGHGQTLSVTYGLHASPPSRAVSPQITGSPQNMESGQ